MSAVELHIAGDWEQDGQSCRRCGAVLSANRTAFGPDRMVVMRTGHYASAANASAEEMRTGALCKARNADNGIRLHINGEDMTVTRAGALVMIERPKSIGLCMSVAEAKALAQALREVIGPLDIAAEVDKARRFVQRMNEDATNRPMLYCNAADPISGAICGLEHGHAQNHRGTFRHGIAQWPDGEPIPRATEMGSREP